LLANALGSRVDGLLEELWHAGGSDTLLTVGIPPLLAGAYAGIANVDPLVVDSSRAMGMSEPRVLFQVELPNSLPVLLSGLRAATLQVVATATIAAYVKLGGLGRYIFDGLARREYEVMVGGAVLAVVLALLTEAAFALLARVTVAQGVRHRATAR